MSSLKKQVLANLRRFARANVPLQWRQLVAIFIRDQSDRADKIDFTSERRAAIPEGWLQVASLTQPLIEAPGLTEKRANLEKAIALTSGILIRPRQTLSIWRCLGPPTKKRGWASGRTIINDVLTTDPGGGLCQFSSLIYHLGLLVGMTVLERYHHSRDIYLSDDARFTPLGLDATIVYGFKDLRLLNETSHDFILTFEMGQSSFSGQIWSQKRVTKRKLVVERKDQLDWRDVAIVAINENGERVEISHDRYFV